MPSHSGSGAPLCPLKTEYNIKCSALIRSLPSHIWRIYFSHPGVHTEFLKASAQMLAATSVADEKKRADPSFLRRQFSQKRPYPVCIFCAIVKPHRFYTASRSFLGRSARAVGEMRTRQARADSNGREDHMLWKSEREAVERPFDASPAREDLDGIPPDEAYPTPGEVFHEIGMTIAAVLALALSVNLVLNALGI